MPGFFDYLRGAMGWWHGQTGATQPRRACLVIGDYPVVLLATGDYAITNLTIEDRAVTNLTIGDVGCGA